jgi:hypothetical protein
MSAIVFDEQFVIELQENPARLLTDLGVEPTKELLGAIAGLNTEALMAIAQEYRIAHRSKANVELVFP